MRIILIFFLFLISFSVLAQQPKEAQIQLSKTQLEEKRKEIMDAIKETEEQLATVKQDKNASLGQLKALQNKLKERQRLIGNINESIKDIDNTITSSSFEVQNLKKTLEQYKMRYSQSLRYSYETRSSYGMMAFLFSSKDYNEALRRMKYLQTFRRFRIEQVERIRTIQANLQNKIGVLNAQKAQKDELLSTQLQQKQVLLKEKEQTDKVVTELKGKEGELMKEINKKREVTNRINAAINKVIERELEAARKKAEEEEKKRQAEAAKANPTAVKPPPKKFVLKPSDEKSGEAKTKEKTENIKIKRESEIPLYLTPDDIALSNNFEGNKGKLYWPVEKGFITDRFGVHPHPLAEKVMIENQGIDIRTNENANVRSVFEGEVSSIFSISGTNQIVIIKHGNYHTVYNNLANVSVKMNQHVKTKEVLGVVALNDMGEPTINFQIWKTGGAGKKGQSKLNPEQWLGKLK